jgi:hypothetical protein
VLAHGATTAQRAVADDVLHEIQIHRMVVLFGDGRRQFEV